MCTEAYLHNVLLGKTFCPKVSDIKMKACPRTPNKEVLLKKVLKIAADSGWQSIGIDDKHVPDKRWLLDLVATFTPQDEIFKKDYLPPARKNKLSAIEAISLPESFLKDLPASTRRSKRKGLRLALDGLSAQRLKRLRSLKKDIDDRILTEETKKEEVKERHKALKTISATAQGT